MKPHSLFFGRLFLPAVPIYFVLVHNVSAVDRFKADNTLNFNLAGSWDTLPTNADIAVWNSTVTSANTISLGGNIVVGGLRIANPGGNVVVNFTNAAHTLTLQGTGGIDMTSTDTVNLTLGSVLNQGFTRISTSSQSWNVAAGRTLTVNTKVSETTNTKTLTLTGAGNIVINGDVSPAALLGLDITGANVTLSGTNTWRATNASAASRFQITSGTLNLGNNNALGAHASGSTSFGINGGTLTAFGAARSIVTNLGFSVGGNFAVADNVAGAQALTFSSAVTLTGDRTISNNATTDTTFAGNFGLSNSSTARTLTIDGTGTTVFSGVVSNTGSVTSSGVLSTGSATTGNVIKNGAGTLVLSNDNTFSGTLTASAGTTRIDHSLAAKSATVSVGGANAVTFGTSITSATFGGLSGAGNLTLTNADTSAVALKIGNNNANTSYSGSLTGAGSIEKIGTGTSTVTNIGNTVGFTVTSGTLTGGGTTTNSNGGFGTGGITFKGGTINSSMGANSSLLFGNAITLGSGDAGTFNTPNRISWSGAVSGSGTLNIGVTTTVSRADLQNNWTSFTGTANFTGSGGVRLISNGGTFNASSFQNTTLDLGGAVGIQPVTNSFGNTYLIGSLSGSSANASLGGGTSGTATYSIGALDATTSFAGVVSGNAALTKTGSGTLTLGASNSYTGNTTINAGSLALGASGSIASSPSIINNGNFNVSAVTGGFTLASNQTLSGSGTVTGAMNVAGTLSPGNSPGTMSTGNLAWSNGGDYNWQVVNASGAAGTGYDTVSVTGTLDLAGLTTGGFSLNLWSLSSTGPDVNGNATNFSDLLNYSWILASTTGGVIGFEAADFVINTAANNGTSGFSNSFTGSFSVGVSGNNLMLNYVAVPEPSAAFLGGLGVFALLRRRRA
jgi:autotransporter-associated beta strand protein